MRNFNIGVIVSVFLAGFAASPVLAQPNSISVTGIQSKTSARLTFATDNMPSLSVRQVPEGLEIRAEGKPIYQLSKLSKLREVTSVDVRVEGNISIALIRLAADCDIQQNRLGHSLRLDLIDKSQASTGAAAPTGSVSAQSSSPGEMDGLRASLTQKLALLNGLQVPMGPAGTGAPTPAASGQVAAAQAAAGESAPIEAPTVAIPAHRPTCPIEFTMDGWKGDGNFAQRLEALRALAAGSGESPSSMAALAEFYLGNGLGGEALAVTQEVARDHISSDDQRRLLRDADLARLLKGEPLQATSVLLPSAENCDRADAPLWRALSAAASGDEDAVRRDAEAAGHQLQFIPAPLSNIFAFRIADAAPSDLPVLRAMAGAVRNAEIGGREDSASRYLLQARIVRARNDSADEASFLERAARDAGVVGLTARVRLAELHAAKDDDQGHLAEALLADTARVYRDNKLGQGAATALSEERLQRGDYAGALQVANDSTPGVGSTHADSRGATLAARVLRQMLADKDAARLPPAEQRLSLYWRYRGYATPGEKGDDIRMGAAQLMLEQGMPEAALDVMRQLSDASVQSPRGALLYATAEARGGDPNEALNRLKDLTSDDNTQRVAADALLRLGKVVEAAHQLEPSKDPADQARRASLLYEAKDWADAADAYAGMLRNQSLPKDMHDEAADHYALALALSGKAPADDLRRFSGLTATAPSSPPSDQAEAQEQAVAEIRRSIQRASQIEALLPPSPHPAVGHGS